MGNQLELLEAEALQLTAGERTAIRGRVRIRFRRTGSFQ